MHILCRLVNASSLPYFQMTGTLPTNINTLLTVTLTNSYTSSSESMWTVSIKCVKSSKLYSALFCGACIDACNFYFEKCNVTRIQKSILSWKLHFILIVFKSDKYTFRGSLYVIIRMCSRNYEYLTTPNPS